MSKRLTWLFVLTPKRTGMNSIVVGYRCTMVLMLQMHYGVNVNPKDYIVKHLWKKASFAISNPLYIF